MLICVSYKVKPFFAQNIKLRKRTNRPTMLLYLANRAIRIFLTAETPNFSKMLVSTCVVAKIP